MSLSLRARLALGFAVVAAVPLVAVQQLSARRVRGAFEAWVDDEFAASRRLLEGRFRYLGDRIERQVAGAAGRYELRGALGAFASGRAPAAQAELIQALASAAAAEGLPLLALFRDDGLVVASAQEPTRFDVGDEATVRALRRHAGRPFLGLEEGVAVRGLALRVARRVEEGGAIYWLAGGVLVDDEFLRSLPVRDAMALLVAAPDGLRAAPTRGGQEALALLAAREAPGAPAADQWLAEAGWKVEAVSLPALGSEGVELLLAVSGQPIAELLGELQRRSLVLLALGILLALALAFATAERWTRPVNRLVKGFERVARGDLDYRIEMVERDDELGRLVKSFHHMTGELKESRERLLQAERVAAWQEIARRLAHEIKNPLSPIALSMENLRRSHAAGRADFPEVLAESTQTVREEVERLRRIVQEFSDFARLPKPRLVEESLHEVIRGVAALHAGDTTHRIRLELEAGEGRFVFDPDQINQLLLNLLKNAFEATPEGGDLTLRTWTDPERGAFVLEIEDSGPGVAASQAKDLFLPYVSYKEGGTGLGLAIVQRIAMEHAGEVRLMNPGEPGARFRVSLPLHPPAPSP